MADLESWRVSILVICDHYATNDTQKRTLIGSLFYFKG